MIDMSDSTLFYILYVILTNAILSVLLSTDVWREWNGGILEPWQVGFSDVPALGGGTLRVCESDDATAVIIR